MDQSSASPRDFSGGMMYCGGMLLGVPKFFCRRIVPAIRSTSGNACLFRQGSMNDKLSGKPTGTATCWDRQREAPKSPSVLVRERGGPFTTDSFNWMVKRARQKTELPFQVHAHMLRHAAGDKLARDGHDTRSIQGYERCPYR